MAAFKLEQTALRHNQLVHCHGIREHEDYSYRSLVFVSATYLGRLWV